MIIDVIIKKKCAGIKCVLKNEFCIEFEDMKTRNHAHVNKRQLNQNYCIYKTIFKPYINLATHQLTRQN